VSEIKKVRNKERAVNSLWYNPRSGLIMIGMIMKFRLRQNLVKKKKRFTTCCLKYVKTNVTL